MPELSWSTTLAWFVSFVLMATGTAQVLVRGARDTTRVLARMNARQRAVHTAQAILDRMDQQAEQRAQALQDLRGREGEA
jgi:hypothetical protein